MPPPPGNPPPRKRPTSPASPSASGKPGAAPRRAAPKAPPPGFRLVCTAGPASGQEFPLEGDEVVIGRASENPVSVPDTSVSRKHALVRKTEDGWAVSDLGSGNGTMLNGEAIADETPLNDGDTITLGDTSFTYATGAAGGSPASTDEESPDTIPPAPKKTGANAAIARSGGGARRPPVKTARSMGDAGPAVPPARARPVRTSRMAESPEEKAAAKRKRFITFGGLAVVLLALLVGWKAIDNKKKKALREKAAIEAQRTESLGGLLQEAKNLARQGKWVDAKKKLLELQETDPDYETNTVTSYLQRAEKEIPNQRGMGEAANAIKNGELGKAAQLLEAIKASTVDQETKKGELKTALDEAIAKKNGDIKALLASQGDLAKMQQAKAFAEDVLVAKPEDREATEYKKMAESAIFRIQNPSAPPPVADNSNTEVQSRFRTGDVQGAASLASACAPKNAQCKQLEGQIAEYNRGMAKLDSLKDDDLLQLYELDKKIGGGQSSEQSKPIRTRIAATFYMKASSAKTTGNWQRAIEFSRKVLSADPGHAGAQTIITEARNQAKDVYLRGYQLKDTSPDEAAKLFKDVLAMTPKDDEYHQKAELRLSEIQSK